MMAPIRLPCLMGSKCEFQTVELEYDLAKPQMDGHMQYAHGAAEEYTRAGPGLIRQLRQQLTSHRSQREWENGTRNCHSVRRLASTRGDHPLSHT